MFVLLYYNFYTFLMLRSSRLRMCITLGSPDNFFRGSFSHRLFILLLFNHFDHFDDAIVEAPDSPAALRTACRSVPVDCFYQ
jgi:hypothetical protein